MLDDEEKDLINVEVNDDEYIFNSAYTILQACDKIDINIPRFCYHNKLKIAGNCRVCYIEETKSNKPIISCATLISSGNEIFTQSEMALDGRESVIEFLLINHPLDCPICDQGGECDLQDQTVVYGSDAGRYYESKKRSVENKNYSPVIKFFLNRCIHRARCSRFSQDISGSFLFSILGRGLNSEISSYVNKFFFDELSGNVIDLCPVGALTSKPYSFVSRVWEIIDFRSIDIFDSLNSLIKVEYRGLSIIRILPILNDPINDDWISDKIRFNYDSYTKQRVTKCLLVINNRFYYYSWINSLYFYKNHLISHVIENKKKLFNSFYFFLGTSTFSDLNFLIYLKRFLLNISNSNFWSVNNINCDLRSNYITLDQLHWYGGEKADEILTLKDGTMPEDEGVDEAGPEIAKVNPLNLFLINVNLRFENPVYNLRIKTISDIYKVWGNEKISVYCCCPFYNASFPMIYLTNNLMLFIKKISNCNLVINDENKPFIKNYMIWGGNDFIPLNWVSEILSMLSDFSLINNTYAGFNSSTLLFKELGFKPQRLESVPLLNRNNINNFFDKLSVNYIHKPYLLLSYFGHHFNESIKYHNLIIPIKFFNEKPLSYINLDGYLSILDSFGFDYKYDSIKRESELIDIFGRLFNIKSYRQSYEKRYDFEKFVPYFNKAKLTGSFYKLGIISNYLLELSISKKYKIWRLNFFSAITDFYTSDTVSKTSSVMSVCSKRFTIISDFVYFLNLRYY